MNDDSSEFNSRCKMHLGIGITNKDRLLLPLETLSSGQITRWEAQTAIGKIIETAAHPWKPAADCGNGLTAGDGKRADRIPSCS